MPRDPPVTSATLPSNSLAIAPPPRRATSYPNPCAQWGASATRAPRMRIGIIGLGAIGGVLAARLLRSPRPGETIGLAAGSDRAAEAIRRGGLRIRGEQPVPAPELLGSTLRPQAAPYDLMLLCTRTDASDGALNSAVQLLAPDGALVCVQNGLPEERAAVRLGSKRTLGAVIGWSASSEAYGEYAITGGGKFILGAVDGAMAAAVQHALIWLAARRRPRQRSGMLQRLLAGRPAGQVDDLNGAVADAAREAGLPAPLNARLRDLVHAIERGEERLGPHQLERLAARA